MSLKRRDIRAAIKTALLNQTDADARVYTTRVIPEWQTEFPTINIYTNNEAVKNWAESPREYERTVTVNIEIVLDGAEGSIDDDLDIVGAQVEAQLIKDHTLGELCHDVILSSCAMNVQENGNKLIGSLILTYDVIYHSIAANDTSDLEWLERVDTQYDIVEGVTADNPYDIVTGLEI